MPRLRRLYVNGNSLVMSIDRTTRKKMGLSEGDTVTVEVEDDQLIVERAPEEVQTNG